MKEQLSHWYQRTPEGIKPCYEVPRADGKGMRATTLADARKQNLLPSVTTIQKILSKPAIEHYKLRQLLEAALTLPQRPDESPDEFYARVELDAEAHSEKARAFGTQIHGAIELWLTNHQIDQETNAFLADFRRWAEFEIDAIHSCEFYVSDALGYAGRVDLHCDLAVVGEAVVDFKSQNVKTDKKGVKQPVFYPEWAEQLAAYSHAVSPDKWPALVSVVIDSSEPGPVFTKVWEDPQGHWESFQHQHWLWCRRNDYNPSL